MTHVIGNDIRLKYESHGKDSDPAVLMIMGLAAQLTYWPPTLIDALVKAGYRVITFDNRDAGLSEKLHGARAPHPIRQVLAGRLRLESRAPYSLHDMVQDSVGLLDALKIDHAHLIGVSMGGMIAQIFAGTYPERVLSLTSIMSSTGNPNLPRPRLAVARNVFLRRPKPVSHEQMVEGSLAIWSMIGTPDPGHDHDAVRKRIEDGILRSYYPAGTRRQISAIIAAGDFRQYLHEVIAPSLIIHGSDDPLSPVEGGEDSAANIKGAKLKIIKGMAHDLPPKFLPKITGYILKHLNKAETKKASRAA